jgi:hypothetical protein
MCTPVWGEAEEGPGRVGPDRVCLTRRKVFVEKPDITFFPRPLYVRRDDPLCVRWPSPPALAPRTL